MAKMIRIVLAVAAEKLADVLEFADKSQLHWQLVPNGAVAADETADDAGDGIEAPSEVDAAMQRRSARSAAAQPATPAPVATPRRASLNPRPGRVVLYTPAGTQKQIAKALDDLRGQNTMRAFVYRAIAKAGEPVTNKIVRAKVAKAAEKHGVSVESVDNVIWQMVNKGQIEKQAGEAE